MARRRSGRARRCGLISGADAVIASTYLAGTNTRRVRRALAASFGGAVGKDTVSRVWRKVKTDWDAWNARSLADEPIVRLILDGTVVRVRLDRKATSISLLVVIGVREDGQKVLLAIKSMGGESAEAWRAVLDDLIKRGLRRPEFLIVDGAPGLEKAIAAAKPGQLERYDCEYRRNGTANLFVFVDVHRPWRKVKVTESRTAVDFAACMRELADIHFPQAERIRVVLDNLSTHSPGALYQAFPAEQARRVLRRLEFHYVPKHASWLNMVEIEIGVLAAQCLDRRIDNIEQLTAETTAWEQQRNAAGARIKWMFTTKKARAKMGHAYPRPR